MDNSVNPKQRNFVVGLIIIGLMIIGFFGLRTARAFRQFHGHRPPPPFETQQSATDVELIRDWMTIPFIARMYHVSPLALYQALDIPPQDNKDKSLKQLNEEYFPEQQGIVEEKVKTAVAEILPPPIPVPPTAPSP